MSGAIVHEWLSATGGSELVAEEFAAMFPDAPITTLWQDEPHRFPRGRVRETWLARTPLRRSKALALPLMPATWRSLPASDAEWVLASSHLFAHHARFAGAARDAPKFVYVHTPARYLWTPEFDGRGGLAARALGGPLRRLDRRRAQEATSIAANSAFVQRRIEHAWERDSVVIHPPVRVAEFAEARELAGHEVAVLAGLPDQFLLGASRFVPYKRLDLVIRAGIATGMPVVLAGEGPEEPRLRALAAEHPSLVTFVGRPSDALLGHLYRAAAAYVFPAIEDFGLMPIEAMATGTPVIVNAVGGASDSVIDGLTGAHVHEFDDASLRVALAVALATRTDAIRSRARDFEPPVFHKKVRSWLAA